MLIHTMQTIELMKTHVVTTTPDETLGNALDLMDLYQVESMPVIDSAGQLCGMLTEQDILDLLLCDIELNQEDAAVRGELIARASRANRRVEEAMRPSALSIPQTAECMEAALVLLRSGFRRLPVTDSEGKVVGTFNRVDVCQALFEGVL